HNLRAKRTKTAKMLITEKILGDIGGWQAMKSARLLVAAQAVEQAAREGDHFRGWVREGKRKFAASLTVQGPTKADARCSCGDAQRGLVCAHAIAVALAALSSPVATTTASQDRSVDVARIEKSAAKPAAKPAPKGRFEVFLPSRRLEMLREGRGQL